MIERSYCILYVCILYILIYYDEVDTSNIYIYIYQPDISDIYNIYIYTYIINVYTAVFAILVKPLKTRQIYYISRCRKT